jgi:hypothetical protein
LACAGLAYEHDEFDKSRSYSDRILALDPYQPDAAVLRSQVAIREGNMPFAKRLLEAQKQYTPDHAGVREGLSAVLYLTKDYDGATRELVAAEHLGAPAWRVAYNRGLIAEAKGDSNGAMAATKRLSRPILTSRPLGLAWRARKQKGGYNERPSPRKNACFPVGQRPPR